MSAHDLRWRAMSLAAVFFALAACSASVDPLPPPPSTSSTTATTSGVDLSQAALPGVPGTTTTTSIPVRPGAATLSATVIGPDGPVPGAQVLVERLVGNGRGEVRLATGPDGRWVLPGILGGRYRVRAWRAPDMALTKPVVHFLEAREKKELDIKLERYTGVTASADVAPSPPIVRRPAALVVQVVTRSVDDEGVVRGEPLPGVQLELYGASAWQVTTSNPTTADGNGRARWELTCQDTGRHALSVVVADQDALPLQVPECVVEPPPAAPADGSTTSTTRRTGGTTTTTRPSNTTTTRSGTTSTTRRTTTTEA